MDREYLPETRRETTYTDVGNADIAGANICHPWWLDTRVHAGDGLRQIFPTHTPVQLVFSVVLFFK